MTLGPIAAAAIGVAAYIILVAARDQIGLAANGKPVPELAIALSAIALIQAGRIETPFKAALPGLDKLAGQFESIYTKGQRWWLAEILTTLLRSMPNDSSHRAVLRRSLASAYSARELGDEFRGWADHLPAAQRQAQLEWLADVQKGKQPQPDSGRRSSIASALIREDLGLARNMAASRAATIVEARGWRN